VKYDAVDLFAPWKETRGPFKPVRCIYGSDVELLRSNCTDRMSVRVAVLNVTAVPQCLARFACLIEHPRINGMVNKRR
jgi:hypothetical protein